MGNVENSYGVSLSNGVNWSDGVNWSGGVNGSYGVFNSFGVDKALFLANKKRSWSIFGKEVSEDRWNNVMGNLYKKLNGWKPSFNNAKVEYWNKPYEAWKDMPREAIEYVKSLPEFDAEMFKIITGIDVNNDQVEIVIEGQKKYISRKDALTLGLVK